MILKGPFVGLPERHYSCILADPPWAFLTRTPKGKAGTDAHYRTMTMADIMALPVADLAAPDCFLFLWVTGPMLDQGIETLKGWGFTFKGVAFTWAKTTVHGKWHFGQGFTTRKNAEICILGTRGKPKRLSASVRELIVAQVREHSRKPDETHERIATFCAGPRLELFAREPREGWHVWGNETQRFAPAAGRHKGTAKRAQAKCLEGA